MVHDFVDLERRVRELENAIRDGDARLKAAYTPTPAKDRDRGEYLDQLNELYEKLAAKRAAMNLTRTTDEAETVVETSVKVKTKPAKWADVTPPAEVNETYKYDRLTAYQDPGLYTVTWEDPESGVKVTSVPSRSLTDARASAKALYEVALAEHFKSFKPAYWFTVNEFKRLRAQTYANHSECMRALHSTTSYERALAWLLNRDVKLKA